MTQYDLKGFRELDATLQELGKSPAKRYGRKALREGGAPILTAYKARTKVKSGNLLASETMGTKLNQRQRRMNRREGPSDVEIHIGTADPAGLQEEFGIHQAANPALTQAWDNEGGEAALNRIGKSLGQSIEKAARRAARRV